MPDISPAVMRRHRRRALELLRPSYLVQWMLVWAEHGVVTTFKDHADFQQQLVDVAKELSSCEQYNHKVVGIAESDLTQLMSAVNLLWDMVQGRIGPRDPKVREWVEAEEKVRMRVGTAG